MHDTPDITQLVADRCRLSGYSRRTEAAYAGILRRLERWTGLPAMDVTQRQAADWSLAIPSTPHTRHIRQNALAFLFCGLRGEVIDRSILPWPKPPPQRMIDVPEPREIALILACIPNPDQRMFCRFVYATGLRLSEAAAVRIEDLDLRAGTVLVRCGKGGGQRRSILPQSLANEVRRSIASRLSGSLLFSLAAGSSDSLSRALYLARRSSGVARRVTMHTLRHSFATHLHERGVGVVELQRLLGHRSVLTTMHYVGLREGRRVELARVGDLLAALPEVEPGQQRISFEVG